MRRSYDEAAEVADPVDAIMAEDEDEAASIWTWFFTLFGGWMTYLFGGWCRKTGLARQSNEPFENELTGWSVIVACVVAAGSLVLMLGSGTGWILSGIGTAACLAFGYLLAARLIAIVIYLNRATATRPQPTASETDGAEASAGLSPPPPPEVQLTAFQYDLMRLLGYLAKADGRVTKSEIKEAETVIADVFDLTDRQRETAIWTFQQGKEDDGRDLRPVLESLRRDCGGNADLQDLVFEAAFATAAADHDVSEEELGVLESVSDTVCGGRIDVRDRAAAANERNPYRVLGLNPSASWQEVRRAYRKKAAEFHPDRIRRQQIPEEMRAFAERRIRQINAAFSQLKAEAA